MANDGFDVTIALWARTSEEGLWFLYIGSTSLRTMSLADAYRVVYRALRTLPDTKISLYNIKLIDANDPIASSAIQVRDRYTARLPIQYKGNALGDLAIEECHIYPRAGAMSRKEVLQTVTGLMDRTGGLPPSLITLRDGTQIQAVPVGIEMNVPGAIQVVFHDLLASANRSIPVDDVVGIM